MQEDPGLRKRIDELFSRVAKSQWQTPFQGTKRRVGDLWVMCQKRKNMKVNEEVWKFMHHHLEDTDEELEIFRNCPKNVDVVAKAPALLKKTIIAEVVASNGCNSQQKVWSLWI